jgi:hypothetical protein
MLRVAAIIANNRNRECRIMKNDNRQIMENEEWKMEKNIQYPPGTPVFDCTSLLLS